MTTQASPGAAAADSATGGGLPRVGDRVVLSARVTGTIPDGAAAVVRVYDYKAGGGRTKADAALGRAAPAVAFGATLAAGLGRGDGADVRELVVAALAPVILLGLLPAVAAGVVTWRKIRAYERQLGRDIVNR